MAANRQKGKRDPGACVFVLGITGPIASGKSTVARMFAERGAVVLDADEVGRQAVQPGEPGLGEVIAEFGPGILQADGELDREALARRIFREPDARRRLNAILHPRMTRRLAAEISAARERLKEQGVVVLEAAVLFEAGWNRQVEGVLLVDAKQSTRAARLIERNGLSRAEAWARIRGQGAPASRPQARWVLWTDAALPEIRRQVEKIWQEIETERRARCSPGLDMPPARRRGNRSSEPVPGECSGVRNAQNQSSSS
ncbi:MAG: dephospho-CoA kinase [Armatimonadetes bacterium]|nr:dephospho-CoA kinase [Armatimonadota bacterium]